MKLEPIETFPEDRKPRVAFHVSEGRILWAFLVMKAVGQFYVMENGRPVMAVNPNFWTETPEIVLDAAA